MKVFTHYTKIGSTSDGIRWRTILKFGNSWEVKGSVVMKNPGAANFKRPDHAAINSPEELKQLSVLMMVSLEQIGMSFPLILLWNASVGCSRNIMPPKVNCLKA